MIPTHTVLVLEVNILLDIEYQKLIPKLHWMRSLRDVYKKFIDASSCQSASEREMPFFYVRNYNFIAVFSYNEEGAPVAVLNPSNNLT